MSISGSMKISGREADLSFGRYVPEEGRTPMSAALYQQMETEDAEKPYSRVIRLRLSGALKSLCRDTYFIALDAGQYAGRLWYGWGRHSEAVGNFGNFKVLETYRKHGIGRRLLDMWHRDMENRHDLPPALFCTCSQPFLVKIYGEYGFRPAVRNTEGGPLYCPLKDSPDTFQEFCRRYYIPGKMLQILPADFRRRHDIDCLLRFALTDLGETFGFPEIGSLEAALLEPERGSAEILLDEREHCAGWAYTPAGGKRRLQIHPAYRNVKLEANSEQ